MTGICSALGENRYYFSVDVTMNHCYYIVFYPIAITTIFASNDHFHAHFIIVTRREGVLTMGLLKTASHTMNSNLP